MPSCKKGLPGQEDSHSTVCSLTGCSCCASFDTPQPSMQPTCKAMVPYNYDHAQRNRPNSSTKDSQSEKSIIGYSKSRNSRRRRDLNALTILSGYQGSIPRLPQLQVPANMTLWPAIAQEMSTMQTSASWADVLRENGILCENSIIRETERTRFKRTKNTYHCGNAPYSVVVTKTIDTSAAPDAPISFSGELFFGSEQRDSATAPPSAPRDPVTTEHSHSSTPTARARNVEDASWYIGSCGREASMAFDMNDFFSAP